MLEKWTRNQRDPTQRTILLPTLFGCVRLYQLTRLKQDMEAPFASAATVITLLVTHFLQTGEWILPEYHSVRTDEWRQNPPIGESITVGMKEGRLEVRYLWTGTVSELVGAAAELPREATST
jgi:hypothetical protein